MKRGFLSSTLSKRAYVMNNKKVLLRERKRHTARRVASTRCAALSNPDLVQGCTQSQVWGGYPVPGLGGTQSQVWEGVPHPRSGGYPIQTWSGDTPGTPYLDLGWGPPSPLPEPGMGYPPDLRWGTPPPNLGIGYPPGQTWDRGSPSTM